MMHAYICDAVRTPVGRLNGALSTVRADDLAAVPIKALMDRNPSVDWAVLDDVILGCANQAGEDNRNVARMAALLAGLPDSAPGITVNRLCASGLSAVGAGAQSIRAGDADLIIAGGVESMTRAPYVLGKAARPFGRDQKIEDTTLGWRFVNPAMKAAYGIDTMPQTAENVAAQWGISRDEQDAFALFSQEKAAVAQASGRLAVEIVPVDVSGDRGDRILFARDEHPRATSLDSLKKLSPIVHAGGSVTAGNASGMNDGAAALILASDAAVRRHKLVPRARIVGMAASGIAPRIMGMGPVESSRRLLARLKLTAEQIDLVELNEAFAAQAIPVLRALGFHPSDPRINPNGGAIALGHPLGMSGARLAVTATEQLQQQSGRLALLTLCVGVGQGLSVVLEKV